MANPFEHREVIEQERSASSMATYPGRVVKANYAHRLAQERDAALALLRNMSAAAKVLIQREERFSFAGNDLKLAINAADALLNTPPAGRDALDEMAQDSQELARELGQEPTK